MKDMMACNNNPSLYLYIYGVNPVVVIAIILCLRQHSAFCFSDLWNSYHLITEWIDVF